MTEKTATDFYHEVVKRVETEGKGDPYTTWHFIHVISIEWGLPEYREPDSGEETVYSPALRLLQQLLDKTGDTPFEESDHDNDS